MSVQDLSIWHDRRTAGNAYRRGGHLSFQQLDRATDHAEASVSVAGAAAIPSARQLGSSTNSRSEPFSAGVNEALMRIRQYVLAAIRHCGDHQLVSFLHDIALLELLLLGLA